MEYENYENYEIKRLSMDLKNYLINNSNYEESILILKKMLGDEYQILLMNLLEGMEVVELHDFLNEQIAINNTSIDNQIDDTNNNSNTNNRKTLIERAIQETNEMLEDKSLIRNKDYIYIDFDINYVKNTVTALLKVKNSDVIIKERKSQCPSDKCFNADIGKRISIARLLSQDVPEIYKMINEPDKDDFQVGDVVEYIGDDIKLSGQYIVVSSNDDSRRGRISVNQVDSENYKIIDDSYRNQ